MAKTDTDTDTKQNTLPGINPKAYAYKALLENNPSPRNMEEAEAFFRHRTETLIRLREDHDFLRVVLKETNLAEEKEKHEYMIELSITNRAEREEKYIDLAVKVHTAWLELEAPKYQQ